MNIAVIGAGGDVGRDVVKHIVADRLLQCDEKLTLVGSVDGKSSRSLYGFAVDLMDGYAEICPEINVVLGPEPLGSDLIVMAGGATFPVGGEDSVTVNRDDLARMNLPIFEGYAKSIAENGNGSEIVICVSNPNELAVAVFARYLGRKRVVGMGSFLDSLRLKKEIAEDLGVRRQMIHGFMAGEHGFHMVPLWSGLHIFGYNDEKLSTALSSIRKGHETQNYHEDTRKAVTAVKALIEDGNISRAYRAVNEYPPDIRVAVKPFITHFSGAKTAVGTARATLEFLKVISLGSDALICGQIALDGEFYGIKGPLGVPFVIGNQGVERVIELQIDDDEIALLRLSAQKIQSQYSAYL